MTDTDIIIAAAELEGWTYTKTVSNPDPTPYGRLPHGKHPTMHGKEVQWDLPLPPYLTSIDAAMRLVEKLREKDWTVEMRNGLDGTWEVEITRPATSISPDEHIAILHGKGRVECYYEPADTLPRAITICCLKAAGKHE